MRSMRTLLKMFVRVLTMTIAVAATPIFLARFVTEGKGFKGPDRFHEKNL